MSKEVRIGLLFTTAVLIFLIGFYFLKGSSLFSSDKEYYTYFQEVDGLQVSANVMMKGLTVGRVSELELENGKVKVTLQVGKKLNIPEGTVATLGSADLLSGKIIRLDLGPGPGMVLPKNVLPSAKETGAIDKVTGELTPRLQELKVTISTLDSALAGVNAMVGEQNRAAISATLRSLQVTSENMSRLSMALERESAGVSGIIQNTNSITANIAKNNDTIRAILSNVNRLSRNMANAPLEKTINELQAATTQLKGIADKVNSGQGSLGALVNNKELYTNLNNSVASLNNLLTDLKSNPKRYLNFSVFGGSTKTKKK